MPRSRPSKGEDRPPRRTVDESTVQVPIRPPVMPYRVLVLDQEGRMWIHPFGTEQQMNAFVAYVPSDRTALACTVDYLVNGGDEGGLTYEDANRPRPPAPKRRVPRR